MCIIHCNLKYYVAIIKDYAFMVEIHVKIYGGLCPFYVLGVGYANFMNLFVSPLYFWLTFLLYWNLHVLLHNILFFTHVCFLFIVLITWIVCLSWKFLHFLFIFVVYLSSISLSGICYLIEKTFIKGRVIISTPISSCLGWPPPIFSLIWIITNLSHKAFFMVPFHVWTVDRILY